MTEIIVALVAAIGTIVVAFIKIVPELDNNDNEDEVVIFPVDYDEDEVVIFPVDYDEDEYDEYSW